MKKNRYIFLSILLFILSISCNNLNDNEDSSPDGKTFDTAIKIDIDDIITVKLSSSDRTKFYKFNTTAGRSYYLMTPYLNPGNIEEDVVWYLLNSNQTELDMDDDFGKGDYSTLPTGSEDQYYIKFECSSSTNTFDFTIVE